MYRLQRSEQGDYQEQISTSKIDDLFDQLVEAFIFSRIGLRFGYHEVRVKDEDILMTIFGTRYEYYEFLAISFWVDQCPRCIYEYDE